MKDRLYRLAGAVRAFAQSLPAIGTVAGSVSLELSAASDTVVEKIKICNGERIDLTNDRAMPRELAYTFADKHAYVLRNVTLWPEFGVAVDDRRRIIEES